MPVEQIYEKPAHLSLIEAAAIPLAGVTAYRYDDYSVRPTLGICADRPYAGRPLAVRMTVVQGHGVQGPGPGRPARPGDRHRSVLTAVAS